MLVNSLGMVSVKTALLIRDKCGLQYVFVMPAVAILFSAIFAALFMPETHGLSLKEITAIYSVDEALVRVFCVIDRITCFVQ